MGYFEVRVASPSVYRVDLKSFFNHIIDVPLTIVWKAKLILVA